MNTILQGGRSESASMLPRILACVLALVTTFAIVGAVPSGSALADDPTVTAGSFTLSYTVDGGKATITGVVASPSSASDLSIPSTAGGSPVVAIGESAFESADKLAKVTLPSSLEIIGGNAFKSSSITSISFPPSIKYVPYQCFWGCSKLASVTFADGAAPEYLGTRAFMNCSSLKELTVPPLMGSSYDWICENPTSTFSGKGSWRIGYQCFSYCTSLSKLSLLPGNPKGSREYLKSGGMQYGNNASDFVIINYCKGATYRYSSTAKWYFAVNFYQSKADAESDTTSSHPWKQMIYASDTNMLQILKGTTSEVPYEGSDALPDLPAAAQDAGMIWGVGDGVMTSARTYLSGSCDVYPVDPADMAYGWVTSPEIETAAGFDGLNLVNNDNAAYVRLRLDGTVDLSGMAAYSANGEKLDADKYTLVYEKGTSVPRPGSSFYDTVWSDLASDKEVNDAGQYRVHAVGKDEFEKTKTGTTSFNVKQYSANVFDYANAVVNETAGMAAFRGIGLTSKTPLFMVVTPASSWQYGLVAAGLSGVGGGQAILTDGESTSSSAYLAIQASNATDIIFLGTEAEITKAVEDKVRQNVGKASYDTISGSGYEDLAVQAFSTIREFGPSQSTPYDWGTTAIVVSGTRTFDTMPIAQYAYQAKAPVFFTGSSGAVSSATLAALSSGGFTKIVVAGDSSYVSDAAMSSIQAATGISPERVLASGSNAYEASKDFIGALQSAFIDDKGVAVNDSSNVVVASAADASSVIVGAQLAAVIDGTLLTVSSSADVKRAEQYLADTFGDLMGVVYLVGDFSGIDSDAVERMKSVWSTPVSYAIGSGDTVEVDGVVYRLGSGMSSALAGVLDTSLSSLNVSSFSYEGKNYSVGSIMARALAGNSFVKSFTSSAATVGASAFSGCTVLSSVSLPSVKSVPTSAFSGCTALTKATLPAVTSIGANAFSACTKLASASIPKVKTIGASAFSGCTKLTSITGAVVTSIGASAFSGCASLKSASFTSASLSKINSKAFFDCKKLKTLKLKTSKLTASKVGANAFKGMPSSAKVSVPKAKVSAYKNIFVKKGLSKKSKVVAI